MSALNLSSNDQFDEVQLVEVTGGWIVRVIERGHANSHKSFERKRMAKAFAEAERKRLGLKVVTRI